MTANLEGVSLEFADLRGALPVFANLKGAVLEGARLDENTRLPDGTNWTPGADMTRFTNSDHSRFWRSDDPGSPAYRARGQEKDAK